MKYYNCRYIYSLMGDRVQAELLFLLNRNGTMLQFYEFPLYQRLCFFEIQQIPQLVHVLIEARQA